MSDSVPDIIGDYRLMEKLGRGGMGTVYKAHQVSLDRVVALKVLPEKIAEDQRYIERFQIEARASAKLNHPNIVQGIDVGRDHDSGLWFFAMELVNGPSVGEIIDEVKIFPERRALEIARSVARALECAQRHRIVHRDVKPDNIILNENGEAKLVDLGLARTSAEDLAAMPDTILGTPFYIAPEQARGLTEKLDVRADIYSLGATLFHMVTGDPPFTGESCAVIMTKHVTEDPPLAHEKNPKVSEACGRLINRMMRKKPSERFQSAEALIKQMEKVLEQAGGEEFAIPFNRIAQKRAIPAGRITRSRASRHGIPAGARTSQWKRTVRRRKPTTSSSPAVVGLLVILAVAGFGGAYVVMDAAILGGSGNGNGKSPKNGAKNDSNGAAITKNGSPSGNKVEKKPTKKNGESKTVKGFRPGLSATFFEGTKFKTAVARASLPTAALNGKADALPEKVPSENFSVRLDGYVKVPFSGKHFFRLRSSSFARVKIGGSWIFGGEDKFVSNPPSRRDSIVRMEAGMHRVVIEVYYTSGSVELSLAHVPDKAAKNKAKCEFVHSGSSK